MDLNFLKKANKNEIMGLTGLACLVVIVGYYLLFLAPVASKFALLFRETSKLQNMINKAELSINSMPKIKSEIGELKSKEEFYSSKLPREEEFPAMLENLSGMARNAKVKITKILPVKNPDASSEEEGAGLKIYSEEAIVINAQCGYHQLGAFVAELESAERFMEISDIKIEAGRVNPKRHNVQLIVKAFILKSEKK